MNYLQKDNWAHLLKRWRAINSSYKVLHVRLNKYLRVCDRATAITRHFIYRPVKGSFAIKNIF